MGRLPNHLHTFVTLACVMFRLNMALSVCDSRPMMTPSHSQQTFPDVSWILFFPPHVYMQFFIAHMRARSITKCAHNMSLTFDLCKTLDIVKTLAPDLFKIIKEKMSCERKLILNLEHCVVDWYLMA